MKLNGLRLLIKEELKRTLNEMDWFDYSSDNPANQPDEDIRPGYKPKESPFNILFNNGYIAIFEKGSKLYFFDYYDIDEKDFEEYANVPREYVGRDEDGFPEFEYGDWDMDENTISNYLNDNYNKLGIGYGLEDYQEGKSFVEIDKSLKDDILSTYDDSNLKNILNRVK